MGSNSQAETPEITVPQLIILGKIKTRNVSASSSSTSSPSLSPPRFSRRLLWTKDVYTRAHFLISLALTHFLSIFSLFLLLYCISKKTYLIFPFFSEIQLHVSSSSASPRRIFGNRVEDDGRRANSILVRSSEF